MTLLGLMLISLGVLGLVYQSVTFVTKKKVMSAGSFEVDADSPQSIWIPPVVASSVLVVGILMLAI
ncbi:MAG: hypothetical protein K8T89_08085 [Planctomycetes bacterium]|nr:hypothetical protein [Planctomycetota bacterium]